MLTFVTNAADTVQGSPVIAGALIPVIVSIATKINLDARAKALIAAVLALATALVANDGTLDKETIEQALMSVVAALGAYKGIWEHIGLNRIALPGVGIGPSAPQVEPGDPGFEGD